MYSTYLRLAEFYDENYKKGLKELLRQTENRQYSLYNLNYPIKTVVGFFEERLEEIIKYNLDMRWELKSAQLKASNERSYTSRIAYIERTLDSLRIPDDVYTYETPSYFSLITEETSTLEITQLHLNDFIRCLYTIENRIDRLNSFKTFYDTYSSKLVSLTQEDYSQCKKWLNLSCTPISDIKAPSILSKQEIPMTYAIMELNNVKILKV